MALNILSGLPGSGKSQRLIELAIAAEEQKRPVVTFACCDSPMIAASEGFRVERLLGCRQQGVTFPLNHFASTAECAAILASTPPGTLAVFDEAQCFSDGIVSFWVEAATRGVEVCLANPSESQRRLLEGHPCVETKLPMQCDKCGAAEATAYLVVYGDRIDTARKWWPGDSATVSVCAKCGADMTRQARAELIERLKMQRPYPGEEVIYQPVELEECAGWRVLRPDSAARAEIVGRVIREAGLPGDRDASEITYLDVGCNTGFFCHFMHERLGFHAEGVDVVGEDIETARLLESFFRKDHNRYTAADAYAYLRDTRDQIFDVTSAFAVFQWLMIQTSLERGVQCLEWLFEKTRRVCIVEMGYSAEDQYRDKMPPGIDREWVFKLMAEKGGFSEIRVFDAKRNNLMFGARDLFIGIKVPAPTVIVPPASRVPALAGAEPSPLDPISFRCNICGVTSVVQRQQIGREVRSCSGCGSTVRWRSMIHALSMELFGRNLAIPDFPTRNDIKGIGLTDWDGYAVPLATKLDYQNTFLHQEPKLDITSIPAALEHTLDFVICSDVFNHVPPPISVAFENLLRLLKPGGVAILSVPYDNAPFTREHFPDLHDWHLAEEDGRTILKNTTRDGRTQVFDKLVFHGGGGNVLEMRTFSGAGLLKNLREAGFVDIKLFGDDHLETGIAWKYKQSLPVSARAPQAPNP